MTKQLTKEERREADFNSPQLRDNRNFLIRESVALLDNPWINAENKRSIKLIKKVWSGLTICRMNEFRMDRRLLKGYLDEAISLKELDAEMHNHK